MMNLVDIDTLKPASYNPRSVDPARLELVKLSLEKLGWLLPCYITKDGTILSGHQRSHVAKELGYSKIPVVILPDMDINRCKAVNVLFNRSTNDFQLDAIPVNLKAELLKNDPVEMAKELESKTDYFPCMTGRTEAIAPLVKINSGRWNQYACAIAKSLYQYDIIMPIIADETGVIINGIGRLQMAAEKKIENMLVIRLPRPQARFAEAMLNQLSMDFCIEEKYADLLRFNSFRRLRRTRSELGRGFVFGVIGNKPAYEFDIDNPAHMKKWMSVHGTRVIDFGAGHLTETEMLRAKGIRVTSFEPFHVDDQEQIDKAKSIHICREFLRDIASGTRYDSIFISSVLNSVPFLQDRKHIVKILAACATKNTKVYAVASSENQADFAIMTKKFLNAKAQTATKMLASYEENVTIGEIQTAPKVQKYHNPRMFYDLFKTAFQSVQAGYDTGVNVYSISANPLPLTGLREALQFEFDLPYPDGSRMDLVNEAITAFETRLGVRL